MHRGATKHRAGDVDADHQPLRANAPHQLDREVSVAARHVEHDVPGLHVEALQHVCDFAPEGRQPEDPRQPRPKLVVGPRDDTGVQWLLRRGLLEPLAEEVEHAAHHVELAPTAGAAQTRGLVDQLRRLVGAVGKPQIRGGALERTDSTSRGWGLRHQRFLYSHPALLFELLKRRPMDSAGSAEQPECGAPWPREGAHAAADGARGYLPFLASFLSFFSFAVSLGLFVFAVRFLF